MTILEALSWGEQQLKTTLSEKITQNHNPKLDAQVLLSYAMEKPTAYVFSHFTDPLTKTSVDRYHRYIERRARHEPVAYIIGKKEFYKRPFFVNSFVLIPRPETEQIIELASEVINEHSTIIDVGTGSGAIAITLALETHQPVIATEIKPDTIAVAKHNAEELRADQKISFQQGNLLEPYFKKNVIESGKEKNAVIIANLPYAKIAQWPTLDPDVQLYEPKGAIVGGVDGLDLYDSLMEQIKTNRHVFPSTVTLFAEIDPSQELTLPRLIKEYFEEANVEVIKDLARKPRIVKAKI